MFDLLVSDIALEPSVAAISEVKVDTEVTLGMKLQDNIAYRPVTGP